jgi:hypothetical protein
VIFDEAAMQLIAQGKELHGDTFVVRGASRRIEIREPQLVEKASNGGFAGVPLLLASRLDCSQTSLRLAEEEEPPTAVVTTRARIGRRGGYRDVVYRHVLCECSPLGDLVIVWPGLNRPFRIGDVWYRNMEAPQGSRMEFRIEQMQRPDLVEAMQQI